MSESIDGGLDTTLSEISGRGGPGRGGRGGRGGDRVMGGRSQDVCKKTIFPIVIDQKQKLLRKTPLMPRYAKVSYFACSAKSLLI